MIAADLGLGDFSTLAGAERDRVEKRAELVIDQWEETIELETWPRGPNTRLEALLREYHEICEEILDMRDAKLGGDDIPD